MRGSMARPTCRRHAEHRHMRTGLRPATAHGATIPDFSTPVNALSPGDGQSRISLLRIIPINDILSHPGVPLTTSTPAHLPRAEAPASRRFVLTPQLRAAVTLTGLTLL